MAQALTKATCELMRIWLEERCSWETCDGEARICAMNFSNSVRQPQLWTNILVWVKTGIHSSSCLCVPGKALKLKSVLEIVLQISEETHAASTRAAQLLGLRSGAMESHFATGRTVPESEAKCMGNAEPRKGEPQVLGIFGPFYSAGPEGA